MPLDVSEQCSTIVKEQRSEMEKKVGRRSKKAEIEARLGEPLEDYLRRRYINEGATMRVIAADLEVGVGTLSRWFDDYTISTRRWVTMPPDLYGPNPVRIPRWLPFDERLNQLPFNARTFWFILRSHAYKDGWVGFTHEAIEQGTLSMTGEDVREALDILVRQGFITHLETSARGNIYRVMSPTKWPWRKSGENGEDE